MKKRILDLAAASVCLAIFGVAWRYPEQVGFGTAILYGSGLAAVLWLFLAIHEKEDGGKFPKGSMDSLSERSRIRELVLLSEEDRELTVWSLLGRTSALIGREGKENEADIDLSQSPYAGMVEPQHAVLNFSTGDWYVEDLGSTNGLSLKKAADGRLYRLSPDIPCRLEPGDCLYVGMNRLLLR